MAKAERFVEKNDERAAHSPVFSIAIYKGQAKKMQRQDIQVVSSWQANIALPCQRQSFNSSIVNSQP
jgi:hypothetical protein